MMKQKISVLMDGELFEDEASSLLDLLKKDAEVHKDWEIYHLIGDALRQPEHIHCGLSEKVRVRLQEEPTILAPLARAVKHRVRSLALSAAASLSAVGVVAWMSMQISPEVAPQLAMQQTGLHAASFQIKSSANDYLRAHQEFSPSADMNGNASYIRAASYYPDESSVGNNLDEK